MREKDHFLLTHTQFKTFGAGVPSQGKLIPSTDGSIAFASNLRLPNIHWIVSRHVQSSIVVGNLIWPIYQDVPDYTEVSLQADSVPLWRFLTKDSCLNESS